MMTEDERLQPKPIAISAVRDQVYHVFPNDLNAQNTVFGGLIMALMDRYSAVVAHRHAECICVTVGVDAVHFLSPAVRGDTLIFNASVNRAWRTSMEIGCRVEASAIGERERRHILSAYLTFVATDENRKPRGVPQAVPNTSEELRRHAEAELRRQNRLQHAEALKKLRMQDVVSNGGN
jgi:acyl-CoA hydrolase